METNIFAEMMKSDMMFAPPQENALYQREVEQIAAHFYPMDQPSGQNARVGRKYRRTVVGVIPDWIVTNKK